MLNFNISGATDHGPKTVVFLFSEKNHLTFFNKLHY